MEFGDLVFWWHIKTATKTPKHKISQKKSHMELNIINQLASQKGIRSNEPNKAVAAKCIENPKLLKEIAGHLKDNDNKLVADCAEVMTEVALSNPSLIAEFALDLIPLINNKDNRIKWESIHALSLVASLVPDLIFSILPHLEEIMHRDKSIIARDYTADTIAGYAGTGSEAADNAYPILKKILILWDGRHAARALEGLINIYKVKPALKNEFEKIADVFLDNPRSVIRKAAIKLKKIINHS